MDTREGELIDVDFEEIPENVGGVDNTKQKEAEQPERINPELDSLEKEQQDERDYFAKKEKEINKTKAKLQELLEKLQAKPPKETIAKKLLRLRINRLRTHLNRSMEKFNIEYAADLEENENYAKFEAECDEIRNRIEGLEDREDELEYQLEYYTKRENYKGKNRARIDANMQKMAPKSRKSTGKAQTIKNGPRKSKTQELEDQLDEIGGQIDSLYEELAGRVADYKEYKTNLKAQVKADVNVRMQELKEEEIKRKQQQKEELAVAKPSVWATIRGAVKKAINRVSEWNENRKKEKLERNVKKDSFVKKEAEVALNTPTKRKKFTEKIQINPILRMYLEESEKDGFNRKEFLNRIARSEDKFTIEQMREGMRQIDNYRAEQVKMHKDIAQTFDAAKKENEAKIEKENQK